MLTLITYNAERLCFSNSSKYYFVFVISVFVISVSNNIFRDYVSILIQILIPIF